MKLKLLILLGFLLIVLITCRKEDELNNKNPITKTELADKAIILSKNEAEEIIMIYDEVSKKMFIKAKSSYGGKIANKGNNSYKSASSGILEVGTVLTCEPTLNIPNGMLIKIIEIEPYNSPTYGAGYNVGFQNAQIEELIKDLLKSEDTKSLEAQTIENEGGVTSAINFSELKFTVSKSIKIKEKVGADSIQIDGKLSGTASLEKDYKLGLEVNNHVVQYFALAVTNKDKINFKFEGSITGKKSKEIKLATIKGKPMVFNLGPVPITVTPVFELNVLLEMNGKASMNITFVKYEKENTFGVKYNNGNWGTIDYTLPQDNTNNEFSLSLSGKLKIALEAELKGKFYGGLAYLSAFGNAYAEFTDRVNFGESAKADLALGYEFGLKAGLNLWSKTFSSEISYTPIKNEYKKSVIDLILGNPNTNPYLNPNLTYGSVTDIDGNTYATIQIGTQTWMAENLKTTKYNDGVVIPEIADYNAYMGNEGAWAYYAKSSLFNIYKGKHYNWYAVSKGKLCPNGWRIPSKVDWENLISYLGGSVEAGKKLRALFNDEKSPNTTKNFGATNESGFSAIMAGMYDYNYRTYPGTPWGLGNNDFGSFWTSDVYSSYGINYMMNSTQNLIVAGDKDKDKGSSCRCVKN